MKILYNIDLKASSRPRSCHAGQWLILIERARRTLSYWRHVTCIWVGFESEPGGCLGSFVRYFPRGQRGCNPNGRTRTAAIGIGLSARLFSWLPLKLRSAEDSEQDGAVCGWSFDEDDLARSGRSRRGSIIKAVCPHRPRGQLSSFLWFVFSLTGSPRTNSRRSPLCPLPLCLFFTALPWRERYHPGSNFLHYNVDVRRLIPVNYSAVPTERPVGSTVQKSLVLSPDLGVIRWTVIFSVRWVSDNLEDYIPNGLHGRSGFAGELQSGCSSYSSGRENEQRGFRFSFLVYAARGPGR